MNEKTTKKEPKQEKKKVLEHRLTIKPQNVAVAERQ